MNHPLTLLFLSLSTAALAAPPQTVDFARDVQPILSDNCYQCHGPDANHRKADLRLDTLSDPKLSPFTPRDGYTLITPSKPDDSVLVLRITSDDPETVMPPPKSNRKLTESQKQTLTTWIIHGAKWGKHWSFEPPHRPPTPAVKNSTWPLNPIDNFILSKLESEDLHPSPPASKQTLLRRVTLDLTGLPPTPAELDAFLADTSPDAYEKVVDRLLASPRYGEQMTWPWLDAARYADTNGYQNDPTRTAWPWRDWVIRSFNANLPFDQFILQQLAGDLLPNATLDQRLATAFNRNHPFNGEGGRIPEETRVENVLDRTDTVGTVFLGLTIGCAKCHDHKFDPITQKDYYSLSAYFNQSSETGEQRYVNGGNVFPVMDYASPEESAKSTALKKAWDTAESNLKSATPKINAAQSAWESSLLTPVAGASRPRPSATTSATTRGTGLQPVLPLTHSKTPPTTRDAGVSPAQSSSLQPTTWHPIRPTSATSTNGATLEILSADNSVLASGESPDTDTHDVTLRTTLTQITGLRIEPLPDVSLPAGGPGRANDVGNFVLTNLELIALSTNDPTQSVKGQFAYADATYEQPSFPASAAFDGDPAKTGWAVFKAPDKNHLSAIFALKSPLRFNTPGPIEVRVRLHYDFADNRKHTMGRFRLSLTSDPVVPPTLAAALSTPKDKRTPEESKTIRDFYRNRINPDYPALASSVESTKKASKDFDATITKIMVMDDAHPRDTFVLTKGAYDKPTDKVLPATPAILTTPSPSQLGTGNWELGTTRPSHSTTRNSEPGTRNSTRLDLANWIISPENPLTARVTVNRLWQQFFGTGLVKTVDDFGLQGERPANQPLLDFLATEFTSSHWNTKHLIRLIVTSQTYKQSSTLTPALLEKDPEDRLLARFPRYRLPSPTLRDQALFASGLFVDRLGGPPVKPYQPPGIWEEATFGFIKYDQDHGDALYRRSLYTFWRRIVGPAEFFDVPSRSVCSVRPSRTNTPLHALTTLNDPTFVESARALAQRLLEQPAADPAARLTTAYRLLLTRPPTDKELSILLPSLSKLISQYASDQPAALKLLSVGESKRNDKLDPTEHAAYTALCLSLLNLDETLNKE